MLVSTLPVVQSVRLLCLSIPLCFHAAEIPLGTAGTLQYALLNPPVTNETFVELDLKVSVAAWRWVSER